MNKLSPLPLLLAGAAPLAAQEASEIYELEVTAVHERRAETALPVTVLSGEALRDASRATLGDTLASQPGISNASFGPGVGQSVIRGQQGRRVLTLANGVPIADASANSSDHANALEPLLAEAVEVLRGPATLLYGGGAIGGVVNVSDRRIARRLPVTPSFALEARHDDAADQDNLVGRLDFATGRLVWHFDALRRSWNDLDIPGAAIDPALFDRGAAGGDHEHDDHDHDDHDDHGQAGVAGNSFGHVAGTGGRSDSATAGLSWVFDQGYLGIAVQRIDNRYGLPAGLHGPAAHDQDHGEEHDHDHEHDHDDHAAHGVYIDMESTRSDLEGEWRFDRGPVESLKYQLSHSRYRHAELEDGGVVGTRFANDAWQQRLQLSHAEWRGWHGVLGWQSSREDFGAAGAEAYIPPVALRSQGLFLVEDHHFGAVTLEFGARLGRDELDPRSAELGARSFHTHSLSASALVDLAEPLTLGLAWSRSARAPSVEELYANAGLQGSADCVIHYATRACEIGDAAFREERSNNVDLSLYLDLGNLDATFTLFHNRFRDYLHLADTGLAVAGIPLRRYAQADARFRGLEADLALSLSEGWEWRLFGDLIESEISGLGAAPRMPPARLGSELSWSGQHWSGGLSVLHAWRQDEPGAFEAPTPGYTRWDLNLDWRPDTRWEGETQFFARLRNLTDAEIRLSTSALRAWAPEAGRSIELGWRYSR